MWWNEKIKMLVQEKKWKYLTEITTKSRRWTNDKQGSKQLRKLIKVGMKNMNLNKEFNSYICVQTCGTL